MPLDALDYDLLKKTWCNHLPLPDYPRGVCCRKPTPYEDWTTWRKKDFREASDPTVLFHENRWYLYPSAGMAFVSDDFITWSHHRLQPYDAGYGPTVFAFRGRFYLTAANAPLYAAPGPLGPFEPAGKVELPPASGEWLDPMYFVDDDGQLYAYWGWSGYAGDGGVFGARMDPAAPWRLASAPRKLIDFDPSHVWERQGDYNEDAGKSAVEGAWMLKHAGRYYLVYAAPGTQYRTYAMGAYVGGGPLGPFTYQRRNPIVRQTEGLVHGPGHGCVTPGPNGTLWGFYTSLARNLFKFERRVGMDPAGFDANGDLFILGATETPQWAPGLVERPELGNSTGLLPISVNKPVAASSFVPGREPEYAVDNSMRTWWQAAPGDRQPTLEIELRGDFVLAAVRIHWAEPGLDYDNGVVPGPVAYRIEAATGGKTWRTVLDRSKNNVDLLIDYQAMPPCPATHARLVILGHAPGIEPGVVSLTLFGLSKAAVARGENIRA